jgi:hypothetical protein
MKRIYIFLLSFILLFGASTDIFAARTIVKSYVRKDGSFVKSHYRSTSNKKIKY